MKKFLLALITITALTSATCLGQVPINNSGFEGSVDLSTQKYPYEFWETSTAGGSSAAFDLEETNPAELTKSAKLVVSDWNGTRPGDRWNVQLKHKDIYNFTPNVQYILTFKAKASVINTKVEGIVTLGQKSNGVTHRVYQPKYLSTSWEEYQIYFKIDPAVVVAIEGKLGLSIQSDATIWFDDFTISEVNETNIVDGSLENSSWSLDATDNVGIGTVDYLIHAQNGDIKDGQQALLANITTAPDRVYDMKATLGLPDAIKNKSIRVSFWGKTDDASGTQQKIYLPWHYTSTTKAPTFNLNNQWEKHSVVLDYTDNALAKGNNIIFYFWQKATYYVDNVSIDIVTNGVNNAAPVVNAGSNITCAPGDAITLSAQVSDPDGDIYSVWWSLPDTEEALKVNAEERKTSTLTFTAPSSITENTDLVFTLTGDDNLLQGTNSVTVTVKPVTTGVDNLDITKKYFFPNPAQNNIHFSNEVTVVDFYNMNGTHLKQHFLTSHTMDIAEYPAGIYLLKLTLKNGTVITNKLLKR